MSRYIMDRRPLSGWKADAGWFGESGRWAGLLGGGGGEFHQVGFDEVVDVAVHDAVDV